MNVDLSLFGVPQRPFHLQIQSLYLSSGPLSTGLSNMHRAKISEFFENIKRYQKVYDDNFDEPPDFITKLRPYQRKTVKWMLDREINNDLFKSDGSSFSGGILADEMGLGKTVEMLSCIMANTAPLEFYNQKILVKESKIETADVIRVLTSPSTSKCSRKKKLKKDKNAKKTSNRIILESWYNSILNEMSPLKKKIEFKVDDILKCYCVDSPSDSSIVICAICGHGQHAQCVNFSPKPFQEVPYLCADCWTTNYKLPCKATLIVVPLSILNQWTDEIKKHISKPGLKVLIYNGVHEGYIQPISFNEYDVVLTSYTNLSRDLNYVTNCDSRKELSLRHSKKYYYPQSPLPCLKWWRICLDEGQSVENICGKLSEMTSCLSSVHKWAMTGTPIQKSLLDIYGILKFLDVCPYNDRKQFIQLIKGEASFMYEWLSKLIWRNFIHDVNSELEIPEQTLMRHWLTFSQIEKHFYQTQHADCATTFLDIINKHFPCLDVSLKNIDRSYILLVVAPLYKLRQSCVHPQVVRGQFLKMKGTMTMEKLMDVMIEKCCLECNDILRSLVSQHNAIAGLHLIRSEYADAVEHYRTVLGLVDKFKDKQIKVDTCQKIHVMYNLSTVLDEHTAVSHALNDSNLKTDMEQLEKEYLGTSERNIESTRKTVTFYSVKVAKLIGKRTLGYSEWWSDLLDWIFSPKEFLNKVKMELDDYRVPGVPNIANKLKSVNDVYNILSVWLADLDSARVDTLKVLNVLETVAMNDLVQDALTCHLRIKTKKNTATKKTCLLCKAENQLKEYESLLFSVSNKQKNSSTDKTEEKDEDTMYESTSKGLWKMSQKEFLLMKLFQYGQAKIINKNCLNDASEHMKVLELVRKEFRYLRLLWTHLSDSLSAHDEIVMAKSRLRLGVDFEPETDDTNGPPKKKTKTDEENDVVFEHYVDYNMMSLKTELPCTKDNLEKKIRTLLYLENLKKEKGNSTELEPCPICCLTVDYGWAVLQCGHSICNQCIASLCSHSVDFEVVCPMCRSNTHMDSISYVKNNRESDIPGVVVKGSFSTKIECVTLKLMELIAQDPSVKVLIFSTWDKVLTLLGEALEQNSINYRILKSGNTFNRTLRDFKTNEKISALLMSLKLGSKGLNLTEATRVIFMEPVLNSADELQAIGRIHRIGQTKPTFIHHFIIRDSIEENITNMLSSDLSLDCWDEITLAQMIKVFERNRPEEETPLNQNIETHIVELPRE